MIFPVYIYPLNSEQKLLVISYITEPQQLKIDVKTESLKFALNSNNVLFDEYMYLQLFVIAMGTKCTLPHACLSVGFSKEKSVPTTA